MAELAVVSVVAAEVLLCDTDALVAFFICPTVAPGLLGPVTFPGSSYA